MSKFVRTSPSQIESPCAHCGRILFLRTYKVARAQRNFCDHRCYGAWITANQRGGNASRWNGGTRMRGDGRTTVYAPSHPFADAHGYVRRYRLVAEGVIGRFLLPGEVVHHKDGDCTNDDPRNLEVFANNAEHKRARHTLGGKWARKYDRCMRCGLDTSKHSGKGVCHRCQENERGRTKRALDRAPERDD